MMPAFDDTMHVYKKTCCMISDLNDPSCVNCMTLKKGLYAIMLASATFSAWSISCLYRSSTAPALRTPPLLPAPSAQPVASVRLKLLKVSALQPCARSSSGRSATWLACNVATSVLRLRQHATNAFTDLHSTAGLACIMLLSMQDKSCMQSSICERMNTAYSMCGHSSQSPG